MHILSLGSIHKFHFSTYYFEDGIGGVVVEVAVSIPDQDIPKTLKLVVMASLLAPRVLGLAL